MASFFFISDVVLDDEENIYVLDSKRYMVKKFSSEGRLLAQSDRKGQGPGKFLMPVKLYYKSGNLFVYDGKKRRIILFNEVLRFKEELSVVKYVTEFFVEKNRFYAVFMAQAGKFHFAALKRAGNRLEPDFYFFDEEAPYIKNNARLK